MFVSTTVKSVTVSRVTTALSNDRGEYRTTANDESDVEEGNEWKESLITAGRAELVTEWAGQSNPSRLQQQLATTHNQSQILNFHYIHTSLDR